MASCHKIVAEIGSSHIVEFTVLGVPLTTGVEHFLTWRQLLRPTPNFLTASLAEEVEHLQMAFFHRHPWLN